MAKRVDQNQKEIVKIFRQLGVSVQVLSDIGKGCPDLLIGMHGQNLLVEIKNGNKPPSGQKLTEAEEAFFDSWRGQVCIVKNEIEAISLVNGILHNN